MHLSLYILLYLIPKIVTKQIEIKCPQHCRCDIFENLKRATCTNRNLARVESNFPEQTELLDLSYNQISSLDDHVFTEEKLLSLKLLNMSHNKLGEIHMNAFKGLSQLKTLDLSYNGIQYLLDSWFKDLSSLNELYLKGNSFSRMDNGAVFTSTSLKILDLSECHISSIEPNTFTGVPNLEILDLSGNYLIHLNATSIKPLENLNILNMNQTQLVCDEEFKILSSYCTDKGIRFVHPCDKKKSSEIEKFQRMVNMAPPEEDEKNSWIYDEKEIKTDNETNGITLCNNTREDKSLLQEIVDLSPVLSLIIPFIYGIAVGVLIAYIVHICSDRKKNDLNGSTYLSFDDGNRHLQRRKRTSFRFSRSNSSEDRQSLPLREWNISESTPVLFRKNQNMQIS